MDIETKIGSVFFDLLAPLTFGYFCRTQHWLSDRTCNKMIEFNIVVFCTILSILSFWVLPLNWKLAWLPFFGILLSFLPAFIAYWISGNKYLSLPEKGSYLASAMLSNIGTLGGLGAYILFGEAGFAYIQIIALFQNLVFFLFCFPMAQYYCCQDDPNEPKQKLDIAAMFFSWKQFPVLGLLLGIILYVLEVPRPDYLEMTVTPLVHFSTWFALLPAGYSIHFSAMKPYYSGILDLIPIKFIVTPLLSCLLAQALFTDPVIWGSILVAAITPTGINAIVLARLYNLNLHIAGAAFVLTTAIFITVIYPLLFFWFSKA